MSKVVVLHVARAGGGTVGLPPIVIGFRSPLISALLAPRPARILTRADLREDKMINPAPVFWLSFGPLGPTPGPGSPGNGPCSKNNAGCTKNQTRRSIQSPVRAYFVLIVPAAKR